ncbi:MAG: hypothetical protein HY331_06925 [Chloroflexi bacterium]|nr:hypothetical protein [Chloroflexota bacterium]
MRLQWLSLPLARAVFFSPDGRLLLLDSNWTLRVWNLSTGRAESTVEGLARIDRPLAFSSDGRLSVLAARDGTVQL